MKKEEKLGMEEEKTILQLTWEGMVKKKKGKKENIKHVWRRNFFTSVLSLQKKPQTDETVKGKTSEKSNTHEGAKVMGTDQSLAISY